MFWGGAYIVRVQAFRRRSEDILMRGGPSLGQTRSGESMCRAQAGELKKILKLRWDRRAREKGGKKIPEQSGDWT